MKSDKTPPPDALLRARRSVRAFKPTAVPQDLLREILRVAASAPSNSNTQPWRVTAITGAPMQAMTQALVDAFQRGDLPPAQHFPDPLPQPFKDRQEDFGARYYESLGIDRSDAAARTRQTLRNFSFFDAPVGLVFSLDRRLNPHSWLDLGIFLQNVMLAAAARQVDTCPQAIFARFHSVIARQLALPADQQVVCGMSLGYGDPEARVNRTQMPRVPVDEFVRFDGFDGFEPAASAA